jgi:hypothetical protein
LFRELVWVELPVCTESSIKPCFPVECLGLDGCKEWSIRQCGFLRFFLPAAWGKTNYFIQVWFSFSWSSCPHMPQSLESRKFHTKFEVYIPFLYFTFSFISFISFLWTYTPFPLSFFPSLRFCKPSLFILHLVLTFSSSSLHLCNSKFFGDMQSLSKGNQKLILL